MKYGYFDDEAREYVITSPETPLPWINYLGNQDFFSLISNTSGGYAFYRDARLRRITRYRYNSVPVDQDGRYFYIQDGTEYWSHSFRPVQKPLDYYECRHGMGYTKITGERRGIRVSQLSFVPLNRKCELHRLSFRNTGSQSKKFKVFSYVEFCLWNAYDDMTNFQRNLSTGEIETERSVVYHKTEYRERRNHYAFYAVNADAAGFDTDRDAFLGGGRSVQNPIAVEKNQSFGSLASGWYPIASHSVELELAPGEEKQLIFQLGYVENEDDEKWEAPGVINKKKAHEMIADFQTSEQVDKAKKELDEFWSGLLSRFQVKSGEPCMDRMVNIWNAYQCMVTFNMSRSASYYESGIGRGMGFRDSNQDLLGFVHQIPERARERILDIAATQFEDGSAYHQYQPLTKRGNNEIGSGFNDDPLWLILGTAEYIRETGDFSILKQQVPFECDSNNTASLFEHLKRSFHHVEHNLGPHGLPLIGRADWNDCLNLNCFSKEPDESFQTYGDPDGRVAESVFIAGMFVLIGREYAELCRRMEDAEEAELAQKQITAMEKAILDAGWDGNWFLRAYDSFGNKVGSNDCEEGKIFIEPQGMCVMAGVGVEQGAAEKAMESVHQYLDTPYGIVLQQPAYQGYDIRLGEITSYPPGYKENAGVFCHNNPWIAIAETVLGHGDVAFEVYSKIAPAYLEDKSEIHRTEPYVYSQMIAGRDAVRAGEAKNSWLTGTAAWNFYAVTQFILGIRADYDGIRIQPCIPKAWNEFNVRRVYRGATYEIHIDNRAHVSSGIQQISVNGEKIEGTVITAAPGGNVVKVEVVMGTEEKK